MLILSIVSYAVFSYIPVFRGFLEIPDTLKVEDISRYEQRFAPVRRMLPQHGVIGYRSDCSELSDMNCRARFNVAQYALSPVILGSSPKQTLLLGNFANADTSGHGDLKQLMDSGNGVILYRLDGK